ncbi:MAG: hypothetical protein M1827_006483 [Pycnora praestabilis]|nr:MAG: hypothetical protein M1827_006483 [Pycnora praestabilis]
MSSEDPGRKARASGDFVESSLLDIVVPYVSNVDIEEAFRSTKAIDDETSSLLPAIAQRRILFFDELISVYVVLRTSCLDEITFKSFLSRIVIRLEAHATNQIKHAPDAHGGASTTQTKDLIFSDASNESEDPLVIVHGSDESGGEDQDRHIFALWKFSILLGRPRIRIQNPVITFTPIASLRRVERVSPDVIGKEYLPSQVPAGLNLLESFKNDPALAGIQPRLSASRVSRVAPITRVAQELLRPLEHIMQRSFRLVPAMSTRVRCARLNTYSRRPIVVASLDFEIMPFTDFKLKLEQIEINLLEGSVEDLMDRQGAALPMTCRPRDEVTFLYRLSHNDSNETSLIQKSNIKVLDVTIVASVPVSEGCRPEIKMRWRTSVDFSTSLNPNFGGPSQLLQRSHRPSSLPVPPSAGNLSINPTELPGNARSDVPGSSLMSFDGTSNGGTISDFGVTVTFSGPRNVYVGETFRWEAFMVNRSTNSRKLALVVISKRRKAGSRKHVPQISSSSIGGHKDDSVADAIADENIVYAMQKSEIMEPAELVSLSTDVRIGPLAPSACHTAELKFLVLAPGVLQVEAIRVVDLSSQETTDIRDLPSILSLHRDKKN